MLSSELIALDDEVHNLPVTIPTQQVLARRLGLKYLQLSPDDIDPNLLKLIPAELATQHNLIPVRQDQHHLLIAMANPLDREAVELLGFITGRRIDIVVAEDAAIKNAINHHYRPSMNPDDMDELISVQHDERESQNQRAELERISKQKPLVRLVDSIIRDAIRRQASDIHLRPGVKDIALLYRIDGSLVPIRTFDRALLPVLVSRIKVLANMDITVRRMPQDGQARIHEPDNTIDLRFSVMPTVNGESVVIRILNSKAGLRNIKQIGLSLADLEFLVGTLHRSNGLILVTGPTGSGKSTTLYSALQELIKLNINIVTIEEPVEYQVEGIQQIQINRAAGLTFARTLRNVLRHDPDAIMVGEIRDEETAQIAMESALTGHLVMSTLHTNSAAKTITRLLEMGCEPLLLNATLLTILAQRLVRRNCAHCLTVEHLEPYMRKALNISHDEVFYRGKGCVKCNNAGYHGRLACYELFKITSRTQALIKRGATDDELFQQALDDGMIPLTEHALRLARERQTSLAEAYRVRQE